VAQLGARLDGIEEVVGSNPIGSTKNPSKLKVFHSPPERRGFCFKLVLSALGVLACFREFPLSILSKRDRFEIERFPNPVGFQLPKE
jgi:hypothetical protein